MRKFTFLLALMLLCIPAFAQEWTILPTQCWVHEWRSMDEQTDGPALTDENGDYKVYVRGGEGLVAWDSQFFITFDEENALKIGDVMSVTFKVKADAPATFGTQSHAAPGAFLHYACIGDVEATTSWTEVTRMATVTKEMKDMYSIAFNLSDGQENYAYFKDIEVKVMRTNTIESWTDLIALGEQLNGSGSCYYTMVYPDDIMSPATVTDGEIVIEAPAKVSETWETLFFIRLPQTLPAVTPYRISFDYKASANASVMVQSHNEPGQYIHWNAFGYVEFTESWQSFLAEATVLEECNGIDGKDFRTFAFTLSQDSPVTYYIKNIKVEIPADAVTLDVNQSELMKEAEALAADDDAVAVGKLREAIQWAKDNNDLSKLQAAIDQFKADNADLEKDETARVGKGMESWHVGPGNNSHKATYTHNGITLIEHFGETRVGNMLWQEVGVENGTYNIELYATSHNAWEGRYMPVSDDNPAPTLQQDANDVAYVYGYSSGEGQRRWITARRNSGMLDFEPEAYLINGVEVTDGKLNIGLALAKAGQTEWHTIQIKSLKWVTTAKKAYAAVQDELGELLHEAIKLDANESYTNGREAFSTAFEVASAALNSNWYNIPELEDIVASLREAIATFKKANYYIDFAAGEYYIIDAESGLMMAAGHDWGTQGIVNEFGLDLTLTPNETTRGVIIDSRVSNGGYQHYLGSNLYMDSNEYEWFLEYQGFGFYITDGEGHYINIDGDNNLVLAATPREWIIVSKEGFMQQNIDELAYATEDNPKDATFLVKAQGFNRNDFRNAEAWSVSEDCTNSTLGGPIYNNVATYCAESYHSTFTISQLITGAPAGIYWLTAQGFYRQDDGLTEDAPKFFIGSATGEVSVIEGTENTMAEAAASFAAGLYDIDPIEFFYDGNGSLAIGIEGTATHQWVAFDNFRLTYFGMPVEDVKEFVDLGLPSGTLWATCNVGASSPEQYGKYFAWGETEPKSEYSWSTYKYCKGSNDTMTKYCLKSRDGYNGFTDGLSELLPEDDAATANWGSDWQMPSFDQIKELVNSEYTTMERTTLNDVKGTKITSKTNGKSIFLPDAGIYRGTNFEDSWGYYWSRSLNPYNNFYAYYVSFYSTNSLDLNSYDRFYGRSVRPVCLKEVYTEFVEETGTMTYYYDGLRKKRTGITELYDPIKYPDAVRFADYYKKVTKVAIDPSMKQAPLTSFRNMSYGGYDPDNVWTMYFLQNVTSIEGLENLNTEIVTDMNSMFTMYTSLEELDLSSFNTSNVTNMNGMFLGCAKLKELDLSSFDVSNVEDMRMMFGSCNELATIYCEQDWSEIVPANNKLDNGLDNMAVMFSGCRKLVGSRGTAFDGDFINGTYARPDGGEAKPGYFTKKEVYTEFAEETGTLTFYYDNQMASREGVIDIYDPYKLKTPRFDGYSDNVLKAVIDPSMQEAPLTSFESMFCGSWNDETHRYNNLSQMTTVEGLENLNTDEVMSTRGMFANCEGLTSLDFSSFNTSYVMQMDQMFLNCQSLTSLDLSTFNTEQVITMEAMFYHCFKLQMVDLTSFNISNVYNMAFMFGSCKDLTTICCYDDWSGTSANTECMFDECVSLVGGMGTTYNPNLEDATYARPDGGTEAPGYFTAETITSIASPLGETGEGAIYNLAGQRMNKMQKGINIVGGRKVFK